jgi:outer membrane lipoprotein-sorting protein
MIRLLSRLVVLGVVLVALYIILSPGIFKNIQANLNSQTDVSATMVSQLQTPVAAISTPVQAAINPTVVSATATPASTSIPAATSTTTNSSNPSSNSSSALTYSNGNNTVLKRVMSQFPDTGVAPPQGSSYDNYTFPRKY